MNVQENLLVTLMEECAEVAKAASKILRAGPDSTVNGTRPTTNLQELNAELDDLIGTVLELNENGLDVAHRDMEAIWRKRIKLRHFIAVSRSLGCVQGPLAFREGAEYKNSEYMPPATAASYGQSAMWGLLKEAADEDSDKQVLGLSWHERFAQLSEK